MKLRATLLALSTTLCINGYAFADTAKQVDISAGDLSRALLQLSKLYDADLVYRPELVHGVTTRGVHGKLTTEQAVTQLLQGTRLQLRMDPSGAMLIGQSTPEEAINKPRQSGSGRDLQLAQRPAASAISVGQQREDKGEQLEEIVVTASKRADETLKEVPGALTALTGKTLDTLGIVDFQDYLPYVPGLSSNPSGTTGTPGTYNVILRGLNTGSSQATATVGYYLDDMPLTPSAANSTGGQYAPDPTLGDVERIEVLKGPQATLYGASTLGGIIKIVSKKPDLTTFSGDVSVGGVTVGDGGPGYSARGAVNIPLIQNVLAARLSAYDREDP
ncbi:MAG: TonB-dependent receptor plug domain-containing protein, partial [Steroidobacteraceae bacterium]